MLLVPTCTRDVLAEAVGGPVSPVRHNPLAETADAKEDPRWLDLVRRAPEPAPSLRLRSGPPPRRFAPTPPSLPAELTPSVRGGERQTVRILRRSRVRPGRELRALAQGALMVGLAAGAGLAGVSVLVAVGLSAYGLVPLPVGGCLALGAACVATGLVSLSAVVGLCGGR